MLSSWFGAGKSSNELDQSTKLDPVVARFPVHNAHKLVGTPMHLKLLGLFSNAAGPDAKRSLTLLPPTRNAFDTLNPEGSLEEAIAISDLEASCSADDLDQTLPPMPEHTPIFSALALSPEHHNEHSCQILPDLSLPDNFLNILICC